MIKSLLLLGIVFAFFDVHYNDCVKTNSFTGDRYDCERKSLRTFFRFESMEAFKEYISDNRLTNDAIVIEFTGKIKHYDFTQIQRNKFDPIITPVIEEEID